MNWLACAFSLPLLNAITNLIDKFLLNKARLSAQSFAVLNGALSIPLACVLFLWTTSGILPSASAALLCFLSGSLSIFYLVPYAVALLEEDASTVVPLFGFIPIFGIFTAITFLNDSLGGFKLIGALLIVGGSFVLGISPDAKGSLRPRKTLWLMIASSALFTAVGVLVKIAALNAQTFLPGMFFQSTGMAAAGLTLIFFGGASLKEFKQPMQQAWPIFIVYGICSVLDLAAVALESYAVTAAGVARVRVISSLQPLFVFAIAIICSKFYPKVLNESLERAVLFKKGVSITLIVFGSILLA